MKFLSTIVILSINGSTNRFAHGSPLGRGEDCTNHSECEGKCKGARGADMKCRERLLDCKGPGYHNFERNWRCSKGMACTATGITTASDGTADHSGKWGECTATPTSSPTLAPTGKPTGTPTGAPTESPTAAPTQAPITGPPPVAQQITGITVAGSGDWFGQPGRKNANGSGYSFHAENMLNGWTNGSYQTAWASSNCNYDPACPDRLWFAFDLGEIKYVDSVKLVPQSPYDNYKSSEYEILISDTPPAFSGPGSVGPSFAVASAGYEQVAANSPFSASNQEYEHHIGKQGRYIMFHATNWNSSSASSRFDGLRGAGVHYLNVFTGV